MRYFITILIAICFTSCCCHVKEARHIRNFTNENTGLDKLIRTDGYFYIERYELNRFGDMELRIIPIFFLENGRFLGGWFVKTHEQAQNLLARTPRLEAYYTLVGDIIKTRMAVRFHLTAFNIFEQHFLIENDTTLRRIKLRSIICPTREIEERETNDVFRFRQYE